MALDGLLALACAVLTTVPGAPPAANPSPPDRGLENTLAVQTALQKGRQLLLRGDTKAAVDILEAQLPRINGNREYLSLLRDAYREYVKELSLKDRPEEAKKYFQRLSILEPAPQVKHTFPSGSPPPRGNTAPRAPKTKDPMPQSPIFRGKRDEDPFRLDNQQRRPEGKGQDLAPPDKNHEAARRLIEQAAALFAKKDFAQAGLLYERAHDADPKATESVRERWAYCKLYSVVEQLNRSETGKLSFAALEREVRLARQIAPRLEGTAKWLLGEIEDRRQRSTAADGNLRDAPEVRVRNLGRNAQGWSIAETTNFRIFHTQRAAMVDRTARVAEQTRAAMSRKWFGKVAASWNPRCDIYLHPSGKDYSRATGVPASSPGHSRIEIDTNSARVVSRRIDLHCDNPNLLAAVLPHETTHVVLAGNFGKHQLPRWADEGMAVLTEPGAKVAQHRKNLDRSREDGQLFRVHELMQLSDYPPARRIGAFYAQSVSLVDFLANERGPVVFAAFLRQALDEGYESALRKHYRYRNFEELESCWNRHAFGTAGEVARGRDR